MATSEPTRILIIEDDHDIRTSLRELLEFEGMQVVVAADGREGLEQLSQSSDVQVILLDLMMPVMNGWEFLKQMRAHQSWTKIPVIAVSAATGHFAQLDADAFIKKPLDVANLLNTIQSLRERNPRIQA